MLDGGSGVNAVTEPLLLEIMNTQAANGVKLSDARHPVKLLEKCSIEENIVGVAGGAKVPLVGGVVLALTMPRKERTKGMKSKCVLRLRLKALLIGLA